MSPALYVLSVFYYCMVIFLLWCLKIWFEKKAFAIYINIIFILIKKRKSEKKNKKRSHIHFSFLLCSKITSMLFLEPQFSRKIWGRHWLYFLNSFLLGFVIHSSFFFLVVFTVVLCLSSTIITSFFQTWCACFWNYTCTVSGCIIAIYCLVLGKTPL